MSQLISVVYFLLISEAGFIIATNNSEEKTYKMASVNWINELPSYEADLKEFKSSLNNILLYFTDFKTYMNLNVVFGLRFVRGKVWVLISGK